MTQTTLDLIACDAYTASAPHESERWAASDRGWLYDLTHPDRNCYEGNLPIGNYLDYGRGVHAVVTPWGVGPATGELHRLPARAKWCATVSDAQEWIRDEYRRYAHTPAEIFAPGA